MDNNCFFPPEWYPQSGVQLTWPHEDTDWNPILDEVIPCFVRIAKAILEHEKLLIVCKDVESVRQSLGDAANSSQIRLVESESNDTWARDHGGISGFSNGNPVVYDFTFNGWGLKFPSNLDNQITRTLFKKGCFSSDVSLCNCQKMVLEGGSIEFDGKGTLMTTTECLCSINRNDYMTQEEIENQLKQMFGVSRILWIDSGYLAGDDTDSHVDTLARFCSSDTIAYVSCTDVNDEHYEALQQMERQLKTFTDADGKPYRLVPLPMADEVVCDGERLPATYANFLIMNNAVLLPFYETDKDEVAATVLQQLFPDRKVVGINCLPLIKQHGSLHCVTMQYPRGFIL